MGHSYWPSGWMGSGQIWDLSMNRSLWVLEMDEPSVGMDPSAWIVPHGPSGWMSPKHGWTLCINEVPQVIEMDSPGQGWAFGMQ